MSSSSSRSTATRGSYLLTRDDVLQHLRDLGYTGDDVSEEFIEDCIRDFNSRQLSLMGGATSSTRPPLPDSSSPVPSGNRYSHDDQKDDGDGEFDRDLEDLREIEDRLLVVDNRPDSDSDSDSNAPQHRSHSPQRGSGRHHRNHSPIPFEDDWAEASRLADLLRRNASAAAEPVTNPRIHTQHLSHTTDDDLVSPGILDLDKELDIDLDQPYLRVQSDSDERWMPAATAFGRNTSSSKAGNHPTSDRTAQTATTSTSLSVREFSTDRKFERRVYSRAWSEREGRDTRDRAASASLDGSAAAVPAVTKRLKSPNEGRWSRQGMKESVRFTQDTLDNESESEYSGTGGSSKPRVGEGASTRKIPSVRRVQSFPSTDKDSLQDAEAYDDLFHRHADHTASTSPSLSSRAAETSTSSSAARWDPHSNAVPYSPPPSPPRAFTRRPRAASHGTSTPTGTHSRTHSHTRSTDDYDDLHDNDRDASYDAYADDRFEDDDDELSDPRILSPPPLSEPEMKALLDKFSRIDLTAVKEEIRRQKEKIRKGYEQLDRDAARFREARDRHMRKLGAEVGEADGRRARMRSEESFSSANSSASRHDPVQRYQRMRQVWSQDSFVTRLNPGNTKITLPKSDVAIVPPRPRHNLAAKRSKYVSPADKLRRELVWDVRTQLAARDA
ncbi:hypothetical protein HDU96_007511 [Phlyctochytrium bullatum]|nr:hypothetical protein HDU96_007511 [Phlyctochytrium bullatum]